VGSGEPVARLKMQYPTQAMALAAARSELDKRKRKTSTLSITLPGRADVTAEGTLTLSGFRTGVDQQWLIKRAEHVLSNSGWVTTIEGELPNDGTTDTVADVTD